MTVADVEGFHHEALLYAGPEGFVRGTVPFVRRAALVGDPVLVAVDVPKIDLLRHALGDAADPVEFVDMGELGRNPACIIPAWQDFVDRRAGSGRPLWGIGEPVSAARRPDEMVECHRHESLTNVAFDGGPPWTLMCPYDVAALGPDVVADARRTHPWLRRGDALQSSGVYAGGTVAGDLLAAPLPPPTCDVRQRSFDSGSLRGVRELVRDHATPVLGRDRTADLVLAASEVAANSVLHGGGAGVVRVWHARNEIACEVTDRGCIDQPLVGQIRPEPAQPDGRGLWIVNQLCDLVQVRSFAGGSTVRLHMKAPRPAAPRTAALRTAG